VGGNFDGLTKSLGLMNPALGMAVSGLSAVTTGLGKLSDAFDEIVALGSHISGNYVSQYAPAESEVFNDALKDFRATLGEQLIPVLKATTDIVRWTADTFAGLTPIVRGLYQTFSDHLRPIFHTLGDAGRELVRHFAPLVEVLGHGLAGVIQLTLEPLRLVTVLFTDLLRSLNDLIGLPKFNPDDLSRGKAAANVSTMSVQDWKRRIDESAFRLGDTAQKPDERAATALETLTKLVGNLPKDMMEQLERSTIGQAWIAVANARQKANEFVGNVAGAVLHPAEILRQIPRFDQVH
jgi:hypothetical protein